jgi:hypothetical protein
VTAEKKGNDECFERYHIENRNPKGKVRIASEKGKQLD